MIELRPPPETRSPPTFVCHSIVCQRTDGIVCSDEYCDAETGIYRGSIADALNEKVVGFVLDGTLYAGPDSTLGARGGGE